MRKKMLLPLLALLYSLPAISQGYKVGDKATDFKLKNIDGKYVSMSDYADRKSVV